MKTRKVLTTSVAAVTLCATLLTGCGMDQSAKLATIFKGDQKQEITLGYGNFVARYYQATYDQMYGSYLGDSMWSQDLYEDGNTFEEDVKKQVLEQIENGYVLEAHASDYNVELTDDEKKAIEKAAKKFMKNNSKKALKELGAKEEYVEQMLTYETLTQKVTEAIKAEAKVSVTDEEAAQKTVSFVYMSTKYTTDADGNQVEVTEENLPDIEAKAQKLAEADDFDAAAEEVGATIQTASFGSADDTSLPEDVVKAVDSLQEGQMTPVVKVEDDGLYVARLDKAYDKEASADKKESLEDEQRTEHYNEVLEGWKEKDNWKLDKKQWKNVTFDKLFEAVKTES